MNGVVSQFIAVFLNLFIGMGIGVAFDCYRYLRIRTRPGWFLTQVADLLFWLVSAVLVFGIYFFLMQGDARFTTILIIPVGMSLYLKLVSPKARKTLYSFLELMDDALRCFLRLLLFCWWLILLPLRLLRFALSFVFHAVLGLFRLFLLPFRLLLRHLRRMLLGFWMSLKNRRPPQAPPA